MTKKSGFKMRSGNRSSFKMMGSSPAKSTGIFDSKGNRISMAQATKLEDKGEKVTYTEGDAIKKADIEQDKETTLEGKQKWQEEKRLQAKAINTRKTDKTKTIVQTSDRGVSNTGPTKGEIYTAKHNLDKKLQAQVEDGTYDPKNEPTKRSELLNRKNVDQSNFPTIGQIEKTKG
jgi:hypothetical protein